MPTGSLNPFKHNWEHQSFTPHSDGGKDSSLGNKHMVSCAKHMQEQRATCDKETNLKKGCIQNILHAHYIRTLNIICTCRHAINMVCHAHKGQTGNVDVETMQYQGKNHNARALSAAGQKCRRYKMPSELQHPLSVHRGMPHPADQHLLCNICTRESSLGLGAHTRPQEALFQPLLQSRTWEPWTQHAVQTLCSSTLPQGPNPSLINQ